MISWMQSGISSLQSMNIKTIILLSLFLLTVSFPSYSFSGTGDEIKIRDLLDRECTNLNSDRLFDLIKKGFPSEIEKGLSPELLKIMEGVVKRTDFDGIKEEKTVEIIRLVYDAYGKGAPLEYLDQIFDVAYAKSVSVDQLYAAANALQEFYNSDVPPDIYEEFVYRSIEDKWNTDSVSVLTRGLIYGVDRGLTPQRVAISLMIDVENGELEKKGADRLVLDAIKLVREMEPGKWRPLSEAEKALAARKKKKVELEGKKKETDIKIDRMAADRRKAEEELKRIGESGTRGAEQDAIAMEIEKRLRSYQEDILRAEREKIGIEAAIKKQNDLIESEKRSRTREREDKRRIEIEAAARKTSEQGRRSGIDEGKLFSSIDRYIGVPYRFGGDSESGIDCSAFTRRVYREQGVELPRTSREQASIGNHISDSLMQPGDLVFFDMSITGGITHVGVYINDNTFAHASKSRGVTKSSMKERYYLKRLVKANRVFI